MEVTGLTLVIRTQGMAEAQVKMEGLTNTANMLEGAFNKLMTAVAAYKISDWVKDLSQVAARYETLGVVMGVMGNNAGYTSQEMAKFQTGLESTGISMISARQSLNMMAAAQLDLSKASALGRVAQDAARIANINSSEAFERLVTGIQTGQVIILHHMGIMVNFEEGYRRLALTLGKTANSLTETEKASLRLTMVMEQGEKRTGVYSSTLETAGGMALSMKKYVDNLEIALGNAFKPSYGFIVSALTQGLKDSYKWFVDNKDAIDDLGTSMAVVVKQGAEFTKMLGKLGGGSDGASNSVSFLTRLFQGIGFLMAGATDILRTFAGEFIGFIGFMIQKLGWVADKLSGLMGYSGKGAISRAGDSVEGWGTGITASMMGPNGGALTSWYDDVLGDKTGKKSGRTADQEAAAIAQGVADRARIAAAANAKQIEEAAALALQRKIDLLKYETDQYEKMANSRDKSADRAAKENQSLMEFIAELDPATAGTAQWVKAQDDLNWALTDGIINQSKYNELIAIAATKYTEAGRAAEAYQKKIQDDVIRMNRGKGGQDAADYTAALGSAGLDKDLLKKRIEDDRLAMLRLKAEAGDTWAIIALTVEQSSYRATDAMAAWMDNTDGLGRSWRTLGDTVRNVIADMLRQMERAIIQQKVMNVAMGWLSSVISPTKTPTSGGGTTFNPGTGWSTGGGIGAGGFTGQFASRGAASAPVVNQISVTVTDGKATTTANAGQGGADIANSLKAHMNAWAVDNMRPGGLLAAR